MKRQEETSGKPITNNVYQEPEKEKTAGEHLPTQMGNVCRGQAGPSQPEADSRGQRASPTLGAPGQTGIKPRDDRSFLLGTPVLLSLQVCPLISAQPGRKGRSNARRGNCRGPATSGRRGGGGAPSTSVLPTPTGFCLE